METGSSVGWSVMPGSHYFYPDINISQNVKPDYIKREGFPAVFPVHDMDFYNYAGAGIWTRGTSLASSRVTRLHHTRFRQ